MAVRDPWDSLRHSASFFGAWVPAQSRAIAKGDGRQHGRECSAWRPATDPSCVSGHAQCRTRDPIARGTFAREFSQAHGLVPQGSVAGVASLPSIQFGTGVQIMVQAIRRGAWRGGEPNGWHEDLVWYAAAMHQMRLRTPDLDEFLALLSEALVEGFSAPLVDGMAGIAAQWADPLSLGYQSQVHGTFVDSSQWPPVNGKRALWQECAHNHWFFLPWHRAYLVEFEAVIRQHIADLEGPADTWGLPYWNYSDFGDDERRLGLPLPLRGERLPHDVTVPGVEPGPDGTFPNPLFNPVRLTQGDPAPGVNRWADATAALLRPHYANQEDTGRVSFGGGVIEDPGNQALFHDRTSEHGQIDVQPHGSVHGHVNGAMALFQTAGLDPVFWMHHCNVDRLWETYSRDLDHGYPFENGVGAGTVAHQSWTEREFLFLRSDGSEATWTAPAVLDVHDLGYEYDTTEPPPLPPVPPPPAGSENQPFGLDVTIPEPVAASGDFGLDGEMEVVAVGGSEADRDTPLASFPEGARWLLRFEGITCSRPAPTSFDVYLGLPPDAAADPADPTH